MVGGWSWAVGGLGSGGVGCELGQTGGEELDGSEQLEIRSAVLGLELK